MILLIILLFYKMKKVNLRQFWVIERLEWSVAELFMDWIFFKYGDEFFYNGFDFCR